MNITPLTCRVAITVPSTVNVTQANATMQAVWVDNVMTALAKMFGGATAMPGMGAWVSDTAGLVKENIVQVFAFCTEAGLSSNRAAILKVAQDLCRAMRQECVAVELNGKLYFVASNNAEAIAEAA
jgi:hypothetical protein